MMKVLHVLETVAGRYGGPVTVLRQLATEQQRRGLDVSVFTTTADYPTGDLREPGWGTLDGGAVPTFYGKVDYAPLKLSWSFASEFGRAVKSADIVHVHGLYRFPPSYAALAARRAHKPYIIRPFGSLDPFLYRTSSRSLVLKRLYERVVDLPNLKHATAIHYTADGERQQASYLGLSGRSFVVPNPLDERRFAALPPAGAFRSKHELGDGPLVLFLGRIHFKKGLDLLIPAFNSIAQRFPRARLVIAGPENDAYGAELRGLVAALNAQHLVRFVGPLEGLAVMEAYVDADVFALTSYAENFGNSVIEAMACGAPVLISDQVNIAPMIAREDTGEVVPCDVPAIADGLTRLLGDPERRNYLRHRAKRFAKENFALDAVASALEVQYADCIRASISTAG